MEIAVKIIILFLLLYLNNAFNYLPFFQGFEHIDPFIPVMVPELSTVEFNNMLDYYEEKRWLQKTGGRKELEFLTSKLPGELMNRCAPL